MSNIPSSPPQYTRCIPVRYVDGDIRRCPDRLAAAVQIAQAYHDDWTPMVVAAGAARHDNTLAVPVARMVLNWARTQVEWNHWLNQLEWDLLEDEDREAKVIDLAEREERKEIQRRKRDAEPKSRRVEIRTPARYKRDFAVARQNGKVIHTIVHESEWNLVQWHNQRWVGWKNTYKWLEPDEPRRVELRVSVVCNHSGFMSPHLVTHEEAIEAGYTDCRSCARIIAERAEREADV